MKLADFMVRDPFARAPAGIAPPLIEKAWLKLGGKRSDVPLVATPADRARHVIDAKADGRCHLCAGAVWMSPSSWASRDTWTHIVCLACLEKAVGMWPQL